MTFDEAVATVMTDMNVSGALATTRIGGYVNKRYREVMHELGMNVLTRIDFEFVLTPGTQEQEVPFDHDPTIERIVALYKEGDTTDTWKPLDELSWDEMRSEVPGTGNATKWAKKRVGATSTIFIINSTIPDGQTVLVEGEEKTSVLTGSDIPAFNDSYHHLLVLGAKADEARKMEKIPLAREFEGETNGVTPPKKGTFYGVLADLRLKNVLSAYGNFVPGKYARTGRRPWCRGQ